MRLLPSKGLDLQCVKPAFAKFRAAIEADDFKRADVEKLHTGGCLRAKRGRSNRPLLQFARRPVTAARQRHLQADAATHFKDTLRLCDVPGVDPLSPVGAKPLMRAARVGNLPLVQALLLQAADPDIRDGFGQTAWLDAGCGSDGPDPRTPAEAVARLGAESADAARDAESVEGG